MNMPYLECYYCPHRRECEQNGCKCNKENDMGTKFDKSITLSGEDSINFANSLFRPTKEEIEEKKKIMDKIESSVTITKTEDGFNAEIKEE